MLSYVGLAHKVDCASYVCLLQAVMLPNWLSCGSAPSLLFIRGSFISFIQPKYCLRKKQQKRQLPFNVMEAGGSHWLEDLCPRGAITGTRGKGKPFLRHLVLSAVAQQRFECTWSRNLVQHGIMKGRTQMVGSDSISSGKAFAWS